MSLSLSGCSILLATDEEGNGTDDGGDSGGDINSGNMISETEFPPDAKQPPPNSAVKEMCNAGSLSATGVTWSAENDHCYAFFDGESDEIGATSQSVAESFCNTFLIEPGMSESSFRSYLVTITTRTENDLVERLHDSHEDGVWIGLKFDESKDYPPIVNSPFDFVYNQTDEVLPAHMPRVPTYWEEEGSLAYSWKANRPTGPQPIFGRGGVVDYKEDEKCVLQEKGGLWEDEQCRFQRGFVCEIQEP